MSHYGLVLDLAKMYDGRSRAALGATTITTAAAILLLLLVNQVATMSLDRLALERNELPVPASSSVADVVVDDMKMAAVPTNGNTDMYMLVPESVASQLEDAEHVNRNTIEATADLESESLPENADMLMLESDDTPAMQLVELPSDITMAELEPEAQTESQAIEQLQSLAEPEASVASPELIEEHVVEQPVEQSAEQIAQQTSSSQEAQLENAVENVVETVTETAQIVIDELPQSEQVKAEEESVTSAAATEEETLQVQPEIQPQTEPESESADQLESQPATAEPELQPAAAELESQPTSAEPESQPAATEAAVEAAAEPATNPASALEQPQQETAAPTETQEPVEEEPKSEIEDLAAVASDVDTTEASALESIAEGIEDGLSAVMGELLPEEVNSSEIVQENVEQNQPSVVEEEQMELANPVQQEDIQAEVQPNEIEAQTEAQSEIELQTSQEQQQQLQAVPVEEPNPEELIAKEPIAEESNADESIVEEPLAEVPKPAEIQAKPEIEPQTETEAEVQPAENEKEKESSNLGDPQPLEIVQNVEETVVPEASIEPEVLKETELLVEKQPETPEQLLETEKVTEIFADEIPDATQIQAEPESVPEPEKLAEQSLLTTIIPLVVAQQAQQPESEPEPQQQPELEPQPEPMQVIDSVLNYVNASFMQQQPQEQELHKTEVDESLTGSTFNAQLRRYDGAQLWRIVVQTDKDKKLADELQSKYDGQLWKEVKQEVDYLLKPQVLAAAERHIRAANLSRIVLIDNLQQVIEVENPPAEKIAELQNRKGHRLTWQAYHRLEDIHGFIDYMAKTYPDICSTETIGYSVEKRPLKILKISNGNARNPGIWIDGGMHAREWISPATVTYIANQLAEGWEDLPEHMRNINWYIHPVANPDGYEYSHTTDRLWRKNMRAHGRQCPGVDLNRNFGYKWGGKGTSASPCSQTYRGSKAFSEPETFYISKFISGFPRETFQAYLSFHSYGQYILYPWGYDYTLTKDRADLDRVARQAGSIITKSSGVKYTVGSSATTLYPAAGGSDDWAKGIAGIKYAYTIEMGDTGRYGFVLPAQFIQYNGKDGYTFADTVARAVTLGSSKIGRSSNKSSSSRRRIR